jgi:hypothetical protein
VQSGNDELLEREIFRSVLPGAPENRAALAHFSVSASTNAPNSAQVKSNGVVMSSASRALIFESPRAA